LKPGRPDALDVLQDSNVFTASVIPVSAKSGSGAPHFGGQGLLGDTDPEAPRSESSFGDTVSSRAPPAEKKTTPGDVGISWATDQEDSEGGEILRLGGPGSLQGIAETPASAMSGLHPWTGAPCGQRVAEPEQAEEVTARPAAVKWCEDANPGAAAPRLTETNHDSPEGDELGMRRAWRATPVAEDADTRVEVLVGAGDSGQAVPLKDDASQGEVLLGLDAGAVRETPSSMVERGSKTSLFEDNAHRTRRGVEVDSENRVSEQPSLAREGMVAMGPGPPECEASASNLGAPKVARPAEADMHSEEAMSELPVPAWEGQVTKVPGAGDCQPGSVTPVPRAPLHLAR